MGLEAALRVIEEAANGGGDERALLAAIAECATQLRSGDVNVDRMEVAEALCGLLGHASPEVRQEIAELCDTFPEPYFGRALERLAGDADRFVQNAAKRAGERRARVRKERKKDETREQVLAELLGAIEKGNGGVIGGGSPSARCAGGSSTSSGGSITSCERATVRSSAHSPRSMRRSKRRTGAPRRCAVMRRTCASTSGSCARSSGAGAIMRRPGARRSRRRAWPRLSRLRGGSCAIDWGSGRERSS